MSDKPKLLLVDDEPSIVKMVGKRLEVEGFEVEIAMDGQDGLAKAQNGKPDLIILDLMLPKLNGYEVCTMLKQDGRHKHIPVIIFTAKTQDKDEKMALECGADAFVRKPFRAQELVEKIKGLIENGSKPAERDS